MGNQTKKNAQWIKDGQPTQLGENLFKKLREYKLADNVTKSVIIQNFIIENEKLLPTSGIKLSRVKEVFQFFIDLFEGDDTFYNRFIKTGRLLPSLEKYFGKGLPY